MRETQYHFCRYYPNGNWVCCHRYKPEFDFWGFTEALRIDEIEKVKRDGAALMDDGLQLFVAGTYTADRDIETTLFEWRVKLYPSGERIFRNASKLRAVGERLVPLDEKTGYPSRFVGQPYA
jgi:hypothetical protein